MIYHKKLNTKSRIIDHFIFIPESESVMSFMNCNLSSEYALIEINRLYL